MLDSGKEKGYLTYSQVNDYLPDDAANPEKLDQLLMILEEQGIELIDESEAEEREAGPAAPRRRLRRRKSSCATWTSASSRKSDGRRIDDPVRMYLTQMGEIPLLKRNEEIALAKKIEVTRKRFRRKVLECDYALCNVVETLKRVHTGDLPFDRTVKVSLTENLEKDKILQRMPHNLRTLEHLLEQNVEDFTKSLDDTLVGRRQDEAFAAASSIRRRKAVTLVEELSIRTQKVQPLMKKLEQISHADGRAGKADRRARGPARMPARTGPTSRKRLTRPDADDAGGRRLAPHAASRSSRTLHRVRAGQARPVRRQPAAGRLHRQEVPQPRPVASST